MNTKVRDSNIELLRIFSICGVIVLHYNGGFALNSVAQGTVNHYFLLLLEAAFICAVDLFVLISGYFLCTTNSRKATKALELVVQVMVIGVLQYLLTCLLSRTMPGLSGLVGAAIPNSYYVTLYLTLYLLSPYINIVLRRISDKQLGFLVAMCAILFSVWPTVLDSVFLATGKNYNGMYPTTASGSQYGYSLLNFCLMYLIGAYLRRIEQPGKARWNMLGAGVCIGVIFVWQQYYESVALSYCNPFVILLAVFYFRLFKGLRFSSAPVNALAKSTFTCFLLHTFFLRQIRISDFVNRPFPYLLGHIAISVPVIFLLCYLVWRVYDPVAKPVFRLLDQKLNKVNQLLSPPSE